MTSYYLMYNYSKLTFITFNNKLSLTMLNYLYLFHYKLCIRETDAKVGARFVYEKVYSIDIEFVKW